MNEIVESEQQKVPSALQHGILSRHAVLSWENGNEYEALTAFLAEEYEPQGPTEQHLVEELAGIIWRKARLRRAEKAAYRQQLYMQIKQCNESSYDSPVRIALFKPYDKWNADLEGAFTSQPDELEKSLGNLETWREKYKQAQATIKEKSEDTYEQMLESLSEEVRDGWLKQIGKKMVNSRYEYYKSAGSLREWLTDILSLYDHTIDEMKNAPGIKEQAIGQAFPPEETIGTFCRYETHLDRKFERTLTVLLRLQEMKRTKENQTPPSKVA